MPEEACHSSANTIEMQGAVSGSADDARFEQNNNEQTFLRMDLIIQFRRTELGNRSPNLM